VVEVIVRDDDPAQIVRVSSDLANVLDMASPLFAMPVSTTAICSSASNTTLLPFRLQR
jgi:hypothetical protein